MQIERRGCGRGEDGLLELVQLVRVVVTRDCSLLSSDVTIALASTLPFHSGRRSVHEFLKISCGKHHQQDGQG
jgi:hypothetical protein